MFEMGWGVCVLVCGGLLRSWIGVERFISGFGVFICTALMLGTMSLEIEIRCGALCCGAAMLVEHC